MICKSCGVDASQEAFYESNKSKCKECIKASVRANRLEKIDYYRSFDKLRASQSHRVAARKEYIQTPAGKAAHLRANESYRLRHPKRYSAKNILNAAVRDGRVIPQPCFICGAEAEAHHPDYDRPLDVVWLCDHHHKQAHAVTKEYKEAA